jgi:hypothetical protein
MEQWKKKVLVIATVLSFLLSPVPYPSVQGLPVISWANRFTRQIDYGNGTYTSVSNIGPQVFWNNQTNSWQELLFENHTDLDNPYYLVRNAYVTAKIGYSSKLDQFGVLYYDPDYTEKRAAEFWTMQAYLSDSTNWFNLSTTYYNHTISQDSACVNVTVLFETKYGIRVGWLQIKYVLREASFLKHEIVYKSIASQSAQYRAVLTLVGVAGNRIVHALGEHTVIFNETQIQTNFLRFVNSSNPTFQFFEEKLDSLGHYESGVWHNDFIRAVRLKLAEYEGRNLTRCDIVIGNYTLGLNEYLFIDPSSSSWQVGVNTDDAGKSDAGWTTTSASLYLGHMFNAIKYGVRFTGVSIAQGATISAACLSFKCSLAEATVSSQATTIKGFADDNTTTFSTEADFDGRATTTASSSWTVPGITAESWYNSTDISTSVKEVVDRAGWVSGNAMGFKWTTAINNVLKMMYSYDSASAKAPMLYVTYTSGETNKPTYASISANTTNANWACLFSCLINDDTNVSVSIFSENITGPWTNTTVTLVWINTTAAWANITKTNNATVGIVEGYMWYFNDTYNNWNSTTIQSLTTTFYAEITIVTNSHSWSIIPGQNNITITEGTINITVTANANFNVQVKSWNATLTDGTNTIALSNLLVHKDTLANAIAVTTTYANVTGLTNQAAGTNVAITFVLWLTCPVGKPAGSYTYVLAVQVVQYT